MADPVLTVTIVEALARKWQCAWMAYIDGEKMSWEISIVATTLDEAQALLAIGEAVGVRAEMVTAQVSPTCPNTENPAAPRPRVDEVDGYRVVLHAVGRPARVADTWRQIDAAIGEVIAQR